MLALPENRFYAAAFRALDTAAAREYMRTPHGRTFIAAASGAPFVLERYAPLAPLQALPQRKRWQVMSRSARAVSESTAPHYAESDVMAALPPQAFTEWQAAVLAALRLSLRWQPIAPPVSGAHPDCQCGACLTYPLRTDERRQRTAASVAEARRKRGSGGPGRCQNAASAA